MEKKKFRLEDYRGRYVMNCRTEEEARTFCNFLHEQGREWVNGRSYKEINSWFRHEDKMCYLFNRGMYSDTKHFKDQDYTILNFTDFDWGECKENKQEHAKEKIVEDVLETQKEKDKMEKQYEEFYKEDVVNKPNHYQLDGLGIEVKDVIKSVLGEEYVDYCLGNVIKYVLRAEKKNGIEDYQKAIKHLEWIIERKEQTQDGQLDCPEF